MKFKQKSKIILSPLHFPPTIHHQEYHHAKKQHQPDNGRMKNKQNAHFINDNHYNDAGKNNGNKPPYFVEAGNKIKVDFLPDYEQRKHHRKHRQNINEQTELQQTLAVKYHTVCS